MSLKRKIHGQLSSIYADVTFTMEIIYKMSNKLLQYLPLRTIHLFISAYQVPGALGTTTHIVDYDQII